MNCRRADQLFSAAWEDELTLVEREALESHMESCTACRVAYDEFVRVMEAVQGLPKMEAGPEFAQGVWSRIRAADSPRRVRFAWSWASFRPALAAAACLVVVGGVVAYMQNQGGPRSVANPSPVTEQRQAPSPVAAAPAQPAGKPAQAPARSQKVLRETAEPVMQKQIASADLKDKDESAHGAPVVASGPVQPLRIEGGRNSAFGSMVATRQDSTAPTDSMFDHSYDVEFALDPVHLSKSGKGKLSPSRPVPTEVQGKPAKVTF